MKTRLLFSFLLLLITATQAKAQTLKTTNLNLNAGGVIHDVAYDEYYDAYVVVGNFTSINGQARNNLAFIDATTYAVMSQAPILSINGVIRSVELISTPYYTALPPSPAAGTRNYLYLGGNFTLINGQTQRYVTRFLAQHSYALPPAGGLANYAINNAWNAQFSDYSPDLSAGVHDMLISGDTLIASGWFDNSGASYVTGNDDVDVIAFDADVTSLVRLPMFSVNSADLFVNNVNEAILGIRKSGSNYYLFGRDSNPTVHEVLNKYTQSGVLVQEFPTCGSTQSVYDLEIHETPSSTLLFTYEGVTYGSFNKFVASYLTNGTSWHCPGFSSTNTILNFPAMNALNYVESYKDYLYNTNASSLFTSKRNGTTNVPIANTIALNGTWFNAYPNNNAAPCLKRINNRLFLSSNSLTNVGGSSRVGFAVFCLEPSDALPFVAADPTMCEDVSSIYTIPSVEYATGYRWTYTGTGAQYRIAGSLFPFAPLTSVSVNDASANSIELLLPIGATGGTLSVEPFATCNTTTDYIFSNSQSTIITLNPVPDVTLAPNYALTCYSDTVHIVAQSSVVNAQFAWTYSGGLNSSTNDTISINKFDLVSADTGVYLLTVTNPLTGCSSLASTHFAIDTLAPNIDPNAILSSPSIFTCNTTSMMLHLPIVGATVTWADSLSFPTSTFPDPYAFTSPPLGSLWAHATFLSNGCKSKQEYQVTVDQTTAPPNLMGHPNFLIDLPDDSLSCLVSNLSLQCAVDPAFSSVASAEWVIGNSSTGSDVLNLSVSDSVGMDAFNLKYYTIRTTHNTTGCLDSAEIVIEFDFEKPTVPALADASLNCSQSTVQLAHPINGNSWINEGWLDGSGVQTGLDVIVATAIGDYFYRVEDTNNGCTNVDTVSVIQTQELYLDMVSDTLICPDQMVSISPSVIGNTETPSYIWSTGSTASSEIATGGVDTQLSVIVSTPSGCVGYDTTTISITAPVLATIVPIGSCEQGNLQVTNVTGGAGNYLYSLDGTPFQSQTAFLNLAFGTYTISVQDGLGCVYDFTQVLDGQTLQAIEMQFAVATYNVQGDTLVLVNLTEFTGLDSVVWEVPVIGDVVFDSDTALILSIPTQGWHDVTLRGYSGICEYSLTKAIYFGDQSPVFNDNYLLNGIDSLSIAPNPSLDGNFTVNILFGTAQNYTILVTNNLGQPIPTMSLTTQGISGAHSFSFPLGSPNGVYRVHVIADYDARQESILLTQ